jgi:hypothetical protein
MFKEGNTKNNLPAQIDLYATSGAQYNFQFITKGMLLHRYFFMYLLYNMYVLYVRFYVCLCMCECMLGSTQRYEMYGVHNVNALESLIYIHKVGVIGNRT